MTGSVSKTLQDSIRVDDFDSDDFDEALNYSRDEVFQTLTVTDEDNDDDVLELRAEIVGTCWVQRGEGI